jgi:uncharacterized protein (DUF2252 family)
MGHHCGSRHSDREVDGRASTVARDKESAKGVKPASKANKSAKAPERHAVTGDPVLDQMIAGESRADRHQAGGARRATAPMVAQGQWVARDDREDPIAILERSNEFRVPELVSIRFGRMMASPFTYFRGAPAVMAADLATTTSSGIIVQACGDAHLLNFGLFATPERNLAFDVNDFDETHPAPWEWDVKRLCTSLVIAAREDQCTAEMTAEAARTAAREYRAHMLEFSQMGRLDVWYERIDIQRIAEASQEFATAFEPMLKKAHRHTSQGALPKLTEVVDGRRKLIDEPPLIVHGRDIEDPFVLGAIRHYRESLEPERRVLFDHYQLVDIARKVVGVGSVGARAFVVLFVGRDGADPLFLQLKEAMPSVLAPYVPGFTFEHQGERVVHGQRLMQAASDVFLGWTDNADGQNRHYYVRQLRDMKLSADVGSMTPTQLVEYGMVCGWTLARAHAKTGDSPQIAGYLGDDDEFDKAMVEFAVAYADQNEADYSAFTRAVNTGRLFAIPGI